MSGRLPGEHASHAWPADGLEFINACPLCGDERRTTLHSGLTDVLFGSPGQWILRGCKGCECAYLDPRPSRAGLPLAYLSYYTHVAQPGDDPDAIADDALGRLKQTIRLQYIRGAYGAQKRSTTWAPGCWLVKLMPWQRSVLDAAMRHMPRPWGRKHLLDIGCGSGRFLMWARAVGWHCTGSDIDPQAVMHARARGLNVHLGEATELLRVDRRYEQITMSHVIEHAHDPRQLLELAAQLLVPGGMLWLETPNLHAYGHTVFGPAWRDLDAPRHLQLFTWARLQKMMTEAGFSDVELAPWQPDWAATFPPSFSIARHLCLEIPVEDMADAGEIGRQDPLRREFLTVRARFGGPR